ncbi:MAG: hypothetical protein LLF96_11690 [Eubacteriales bacterium]|nr:hypothetical protein [Eubacteriales bacterium]
MSLYFTQPIARQAIWGGDRLAQTFGYEGMRHQIGQTWVFSCQEGNENRLVDEPGTLGDLWRNRPELFQSRHATFPFIISLVAPVMDLSIQIHPNDTLAQRAGYPNGKNEAWVFLQAPDSGQIVYGQTTSGMEQLRQKIQAGLWDELLGRLKVDTGDFVYVPVGMVHALTGGCIAYEVQQATDITYRFYDYNRRDDQGNERPLHVEQAIECVDFQLSHRNAAPPAQTLETPNATITTYMQSDSFCIRRLAFHGRQTLRFPTYQLVTVVDGEGIANGHRIRKGTHFLLPASETFTVDGQITLMVTGE